MESSFFQNLVDARAKKPNTLYTGNSSLQKTLNDERWLKEQASNGYDMSGYIQKYGIPDQSKGQHLTDEFKLPNHITFSTDSKYSNEDTPGGVWEKDDTGKWHYTPSSYVLSVHSEKELKDYFKNFEPDSQLDIPNKENI